jgi:hypothetical protein
MKTTLLSLIVAAALLAPRPAAAQGFVSPFIGWNFGGEAKCLEVAGCEEHTTAFGVAFGALGPVFGFEEEFGYTKNFFGEAPTYGSDMFTLMSNVIINAPIPVVRPYVVGGVGLMRAHVEPTALSLLSSSTASNSFGWDFGGGIIVGGNIGVRGDLRYFRTFQDVEFGGFTLNSSEALNFGRASVALFFKF